MKNLFTIICSVLITSSALFAQDCETIVANCEKFLKGTKGSPEFISDGQVYTAFLDREKADFNTTFFGGTTYRIIASAGAKDNFVIFSVKDINGTVLFTNKNHKNSPYWDFKVPQTIPVTIQTELDVDKKVTGCAVMLIGFRQ